MKDDCESLRSVAPAKIGGYTPGPVPTEVPTFIWVEPSILKIDGAYQRNISARSHLLIRRIVESWDWRKFKAPVVAEISSGLEVIDGQHTAIAAATHPDISTIPVMLVQAGHLRDRAAAFIGHNKDRVGVTQMQLHAASVVAGDATAERLETVAREAGVRILRYPPQNGSYAPGETMAIAALRGLIGRRGDAGAAEVLRVLASASCAPVSAAEMRAAELLLNDDEFKGKISPEQISESIVSLAERATEEARLWAHTHNIPLWRALAMVLFRQCKQARGKTVRIGP